MEWTFPASRCHFVSFQKRPIDLELTRFVILNSSKRVFFSTWRNNSSRCDIHDNFSFKIMRKNEDRDDRVICRKWSCLQGDWPDLEATTENRDKRICHFRAIIHRQKDVEFNLWCDSTLLLLFPLMNIYFRYDKHLFPRSVNRTYQNKNKNLCCESCSVRYVPFFVSFSN